MLGAMSTRRTNPERSAVTREALLRLGVERIPIKGYSRTSLRELLEGSGLSMGAFYFHFGSKEAYFLDVLRHRLSDQGEWWLLPLQPRFGSLQEVIESVYGHFNRRPADIAAWTTVVAEYARSIRDDADLTAALREGEAAWMATFADFIAALQQRGFARTDRSAADLAVLVHAFMDGTNLQRTLWDQTSDGAVDAIVRILAP